MAKQYSKKPAPMNKGSVKKSTKTAMPMNKKQMNKMHKKGC